jgi:trimethylamine--corrinoid protein Co-methyltransferase
MTRKGHRARRKADAISQMPYRQLRNPYSPLEVLRADEISKVHDVAMRILEEVGLRIMDGQARAVLKAAGFPTKKGSEIVTFDRDGVMELVAKAPASFSVRGRDPAKNIVIGDGHIAFTGVGGPPFVSSLDHGRRPATRDDMIAFLKLCHALNVLHIEGGLAAEPSDLPAQSRYLDYYLGCCLLSDKPWKPTTIGRHRAEDAMTMARICYGEDDRALTENPVFCVNTNTNTPLVLDPEIAQGIMVYAAAGQAVCVTPFALAGAMAPATPAAALALQSAETLAVCALVQAVRPGCPYVYGSFLCNVDMRTGSPAFGTPEYTWGAQASGQMARFYGLPWRSSNVNASNAPDAQAAYESEMSLWGALTGHAGLLNHAAGWLEGGLVASYEKLILDAEMLQMMAAWMEPPAMDSDAFGFESIAEVGPGGHFFGTEHTLARYETAFYKPLLSDWSNFENWSEAGAKDATLRANALWKRMLAEYQAPPIDLAIKDELECFVAKRKEEIGGTA